MTTNYLPGDTSYEYWDMRRREEFPDAQHDHWESFEPWGDVAPINDRRAPGSGSTRVANWNPGTGRCWVLGVGIIHEISARERTQEANRERAKVWPRDPGED